MNKIGFQSGSDSLDYEVTSISFRWVRGGFLICFAKFKACCLFILSQRTSKSVLFCNQKHFGEFLNFSEFPTQCLCRIVIEKDSPLACLP